ncbi:MAG: sigma 54-interacting transcriptional regulator [Thermodesulfobacteriota bacterium]
MTILQKFTEGEFMPPQDDQSGFSLRIKLLCGLIPSVMVILMITGYITYLTSSHFLSQALERSTRQQVKAMAHELENVFTRCQQDLQFIAQTATKDEKLRNTFAGLIRATGLDYREIAFISQNDQAHLVWVAKNGEILPVPASKIAEIHPHPFLHLEHLAVLKQNQVWISKVMEVDHPFQTLENPNQRLRSQVIYFGTPCLAEPDGKPGYLLLALDIRSIRNILSLYNSSRSPIMAFTRTPEIRYAYLFDTDGWILFQSEGIDNKEMELTTDMVRASYSNGILGKPGLAAAFRPGPDYRDFWKMVSDVKKGRHDLMEITDAGSDGSFAREAYLTYAPVYFNGDVIAGLAYMDRTRFTRTAGYKHLDIMLILSLSTIAAVSLIIFILAHMITKPIYQLAEAVNHIQKGDRLCPIRISSTDYEVNLLVNAINNMINALIAQMAEIKEKEIQIQHVEYKEKIQLEAEFPSRTKPGDDQELPEIVGFGAKIEQLKSDILKAAASDADVLIIGETGTGKQLAAEAIHRHGSRAAHSFISINCGELGETLLLDGLFGHVKGAYTEARTDRKGAFLEAHGGTLFLDEIQNASLNVQQALLRAVSMRKIKPLGSDKELDVDVRLICATNADLSVLMDRQLFRADLYFRLKVITIHTPPLREHRENIPVVVNHLLRQLEESTQKPGLGISRGALEKMRQYHWPGNIRELKNCLTRAAVMSESHLIQADDIILEERRRAFGGTAATTGSKPSGNRDPGLPEPPQPDRSAGHVPLSSDQPRRPLRLNSRQEKVFPHILSRRIITRNEYLRWVDGDISPRTAVYDLQDLVKKGVLRKDGNGPSTRYILVE